MGSELSQFDRIRSAVVSAIDVKNDPPLFPTLIIENSGEFDVNVLQPAPEYSQVRTVSENWLGTVVDSSASSMVFCLAFATASNRIELHTNSRGQLETLLGIIDRNNQSITWDDPSNSVHLDH